MEHHSSLSERNALLPSVNLPREDRKRKMTARLLALIQASSELFWILGQDHQLHEAYSSWIRFTGQSIHSARNMGWLEAVHPDDREQLTQMQKQVVEMGQESKLECRIWRQAGHYSLIIAHAIPVFTETGMVDEVIYLGNCVLPSVQNGRKSLSQEEAEHLECTLIQSGYDAIIICDNEDRIVSWNRGAVDLYGYSAREAIGQVTGTFLHTVYPSAREAIVDELKQNEVWQGELTRLHRNGNRITAESRQMLVRNQDGQVVATLEVARDITAHKVAEQQLNEYIQMAAIAAEIGLWVWDVVNDQSIFFPRRTEQDFFTLLKESGSYAHFLTMVHPDDQEMVSTELKRALAEKVDYVSEFRMVHPEQGVQWFSSYGRPIYDEQGQPVRMVGVLANITGRKRYEEALQTANEQVMTILESITDGFVFLTPDWRYAYVNSRICQILGMTRDQLFGYVIWDVTPRLRDSVIEEQLRYAVEHKETVVFEYFWEVERKWYAFRGYPAKDGLTIYITDITERKQAEGALRRNEAKFRRLSEANISGVAVGDRHNTIIEANDAFISMIDYTRNDLDAGLIKWQTLSAPEMFEEDVRKLYQLRVTGVSQPYERIFVSKQGRKVPVLMGGATLEDGERHIIFAIDLTRQKELEKQRERFLGLVSHELRTPLTAINGSLQLAIRRTQRAASAMGKDQSDLTTRLEQIEEVLVQSLRQTRVLNRLIDDLVESARITGEKFSLSLKPCNLVEVVQKTVEDMRFTVPERAILLEVKQDPLSVMADTGRIGQALGNFISNALKYAPVDTLIEVGVCASGNEAKVWVRDQGPGLTPEEQQHIWERFYRVETLPDYSEKGINLGLGLHVSRAILQQHHGRIGVESESGKGSTFWFTLPISQ